MAEPAYQETETRCRFDKPFVLFMGPQRTGSTWLHRYLEAHQHVCVPDAVKEVRFFDREFGRGSAFYEDHFKITPLHARIAEVSTTAFDCEDAPQRVYDILGADVQLVCPLRHPVARSYSLYRHHLRYAKATGTLQEACAQVPRLLTSSHYADHLKRWFDVFSPEQIKVMFYEDFESDQDEYLRNICAVMGVDFYSVPENLVEKVNVSTQGRIHVLAALAQNGADWLRTNRLYGVINFAKELGLKELVFGKEQFKVSSTQMSDEEREWLDAQLGDEVQKLEELIGPIPQWRKK